MDYKFSIKSIMDVAEDKFNQIGWKAYSWEKCGSDSIVTGDIPIGIFKSGLRKGKFKFSGNGQKVIVTNDDMIVAAINYEKTGSCWDCHGSGEVFNGWNISDGTRYVQCKRCTGTGIAQKSNES